MRQTVIVFRNSLGLFQQDQYKPVLEAIANLILSIILTLKYGIIGIILGTVLSMLFISVGIESYVLYKDGCKKDMIEYFKIYLKYLGVGIISLLIVYFINILIKGTSLLYFALRGVITVCTTLMLLIIFTYNTEEFQSMVGILKIKEKLGKILKIKT